MRIYLKKFGTTLTSRQSGKEAFLAFQPTLNGVGVGEKIEVDFEGVITFTPSWGDEFLTPLLNKYRDNLSLLNTQNPSVQATLDILEQIGLLKCYGEIFS